MLFGPTVLLTQNKFNEAVYKEVTEISNEIISYYLNLQDYKSVINICDQKIILIIFILKLLKKS